MYAPKVDKHHRLNYGIDRPQFGGVRLQKPGEHVVGDILPTGNRVDSGLDIRAGDFIDQLSAPENWRELDSEPGKLLLVTRDYFTVSSSHNLLLEPRRENTDRKG